MSEDLMDEILQMRQVLDDSYVTDVAARDMRIKLLKREVTLNIKRGVPVRVTDEMRQLGIADDIAKQIAAAEAALRLRKLYADEDDEEEYFVEPNRPLFF